MREDRPQISHRAHDSTEQTDNNRDGVGDNADLDDDNDGLSDEEEIDLGTDPCLADTDGDGVPDRDDDFPLDNGESSFEEFARFIRDIALPSLFDADFKNPRMRRPLHNKLTSLIELIREIETEPDDDLAALLILEAVNKVEHDLIAKTDGFFEGSPQSDWVITVEGQETLFPFLDLLCEALLDGL